MPLLSPKPPRVRSRGRGRVRPVMRSVVPASVPQTELDMERPEMKGNLRPASITQHTVRPGLVPATGSVGPWL